MRNIVNVLVNRFRQFVDIFKSVPRYVWVLLVITFFLGFLIRGGESDAPEKSGVVGYIPEEESKAQLWTCAMHPQIKLPESGQCPICFMDLIPLETSDTGESPMELKMSSVSMELAEIETQLVSRGVARSEIRLSGKVEYDETRLGNITAWVPGRLEQLYVDYTGITVAKGDHMVEIYSPELYAAQEELIQALKQTQTTKSGLARETALITLDASREKLRLLGLNDSQIKTVEARGAPVDRMQINSPMSGIVIHKNAVEGMYVSTGTKIYTIADLDRVWVILDAYESDLVWLNYGQEVEFTTEAYPGESFHGKIAFIDPVLDNKTRTVKVRLNIPNPVGKLKPGMFVRAVVKSVIDAKGQSVNPDMAGKWVCPMHPEEVKDAFGVCDVCGMDLVRSEDLDIINVPIEKEKPLLVPASAVLKTGKRAVVYVRIPGEEPRFEGREVELGARAGDYYIVQSGLHEGERVVIKGNFKIDSAMQIAAKPSMMSPEGGVTITGHAHHEEGMAPQTQSSAVLEQKKKVVSERYTVAYTFLEALGYIFDSYFQASLSLSNDNYQDAAEALSSLGKAAQEIRADTHTLSDHTAHAWMDIQSLLVSQTEHALHWTSLDVVRKAFEKISLSVKDLEHQFGHGGKDTYYEIFCPMAFDNAGAAWIQTDKEIKNPYMGQKMPRCGEVKDEMKPITAMKNEIGRKKR